MVNVPREDDGLDALLGATLPSDVVRGVSYRTAWRVGDGAMSVVFYALRTTPDGESPVVVKILRPSFVLRAGPTAALIVKKEAIALGRLNERVPPTPFVVRFIDVGTFTITQNGTPIELPWVAVEYVHGGSEGTTLAERVAYTIKTTGHAFEPNRAAHAIDCLAQGIMAVHDVGVIHRDLKPDNVLCCGMGDGEMFKIADFGVARPAGVATFSGVVVGTPGYVAPELTTMDPRAIGPWSDVFSFGALVFALLTGEELFAARSPAEALVQAVSLSRRSITEARSLSPELRAREQACRAIDFAIGLATGVKIEGRPRRADALSSMILPWLRTKKADSHSTRRLQMIRDEEEEKTQLQRWSWSTMRGPRRIVRNVAWDGDGTCMAATSEGLAFWNGTAWRDVPKEGLPSGVRFVRRVSAGTWLVGADDATFATVSTEGLKDVRKITGALPRFELMSGDLDDLAVLVASAILPVASRTSTTPPAASRSSTPGSSPTLCALSGKRWLKPLPLPDVAVIATLARIADAKWFLGGRRHDGRAFAAIYAPLDWEVTPVAEGVQVRAFLAAAGQHERDIGLLTGADGAILWRADGELSEERIAGGHDLSAASVDAVGRGWTASAGRIWMRRASISKAKQNERWDLIWQDATSKAPIVSLFADLGLIIAVMADGSVVEGRAVTGVSPTDPG